MQVISVQPLSSLIGIYMATSGCPILDKFKPMVRTHLPFEGLEETTYRAVSMYLFAQYFIMKSGSEPGWQLRNFIRFSEEVRTVNKCFKGRLDQLKVEDALLNAIVCLDVYTRFINILVVEDELMEFRKLFHSYF